MESDLDVVLLTKILELGILKVTSTIAADNLGKLASFNAPVPNGADSVVCCVRF